MFRATVERNGSPCRIYFLHHKQQLQFNMFLIQNYCLFVYGLMFKTHKARDYNRQTELLKIKKIVLK